MREARDVKRPQTKTVILTKIFLATTVSLVLFYFGGLAAFSYLDDLQEQNQPTFETARASAKKALDADPANPEKRLSYVFYLAPGQTNDPKKQKMLTAEGIAVLEEGIRLSPKDAELYERLGNFYFTENPEESSKAYLRAIALSPKDSSTKISLMFDSLGNAYERQGKYEAAVEAYQTAILLYADQEYYYFDLYEVYTKLGRKQDAGRAWRRYTEVRDANLN